MKPTCECEIEKKKKLKKKVSYEVRTQDPTKQHFIIKGYEAKKGGCLSIVTVKANKRGGGIPSRT